MAKEKESPEQPVEEKIPPQQSKESGKAERMSERTPNQQNMYISELLRKKAQGQSMDALRGENQMGHSLPCPARNQERNKGQRYVV